MASANNDTGSTNQSSTISGSVTSNDTYNNPVKTDYLINGSLEAGTANGTWRIVNSVPGWSSPSGLFESWGYGAVDGHVPVHGLNILELDGPSGPNSISQTVATDVGRPYVLTFSTAWRAGTSAATNQVEVFINGASRGVVNATSTAWKTFTFGLIGTGSDTITFREVVHDRVGTLLDAIRLEADTPVVAVAGAAQNVGSAVQGSSGGTFVISSGGNYTFAPGADFRYLSNGRSISTSVTYTIKDASGTSTATLTVVVTGTNDAPAVSDAVSSSTNEDAGGYAVDLLAGASDPDTADVLSVSGLTLVSGNAAGITVNGNSLDVDPSAYSSLAAGETEVVTYSYSVIDGQGGSVLQTATITIEGRNDGPDAADDNATTDEDTPKSVAVLVNDSDPDTSDDLSVTGASIGNGKLGDVTIAADGKSITYSAGGAYNYLAAGEHEDVEIAYTISDGNGGTDTATATVRVEGVNDGPDAADDASSATEDLATSGNVLINDTDPDLSDRKAVSAVNGSASFVGAAIQGTWGTLTLNSDGSYTYTADADALDEQTSGSFQDVFTYEVSDGNGGVDTATLTIAVNLADDSHTIDGTNQPDTLRGDHTIAGSDDTIWGGNAIDHLYGEAGADVLHGENGDDLLFGGSGRDQLYGGNGADRLDGGTGNDRLAGGQGNDLLTGGAGNDIFVFGKSGGADRITDFQAGDKILLEDGVSVKSHSFADVNGDGVDDLVVQLSSGSVTLLGVTAMLPAEAFVI
jgi:VCBS repeat-containing protein